MKSIINVFFISCLIVVFGCAAAPEPIMYNIQECAHCRMTISDREFAAQLMNSTGRTFSFDAIECMVSYYKIAGDETFKHITVASYLSPNYQIDATTAYYLIHDSRPSPMGGFLSAYRSKDDAEKENTDSIGRVLSWEQLLVEYSK